jgi:putative endonuclease
MKCYFVYILANKKHGTLYTGFTDDIRRRIHEHKGKIFEGFTKKCEIDKLVYFETSLTSDEAKLREQQIKKWKRSWKIELIEKLNPEWKDLSDEFDEVYTN